MLVKDNRGGTSLAPAAAGVVCNACNSTVAPGKFCAACGKGLESSTPAAGFCVGCGAALGPDAKFCGACGRQRQ
jgi:predicted amidophosphoribosyltransferase